MTFTSPILFLYMVAAVILVWCFPHRYLPFILIVSGGLFLGSVAPLSMAVLTISALILYPLCRNGSRNGLLAAVLCIVLALIFIVFKVQVTYGEGQVMIPLGLSYYIFRQIHYVQESYRKTLRSHSFAEYLGYLFLIPVIPVGPIHRFPDFISDVRRRHFDWSHFSFGLERVIHGYAKLILIANVVLAPLISRHPAHESLASWDLWSQFTDSLLFWVDLYIRFSAASDIAIGVSAMMGFVVMENFRFPFFSRNVSDFWTRWHISLTSWCRDYIYLPVAAATRRPFFAITLTMLTIGLWHEFSLHYVLWGVYHALGIYIHRQWSNFRGRFPEFQSIVLREICKIGAIALTLLFVVSSFMITSIVEKSFAVLPTLLKEILPWLR